MLVPIIPFALFGVQSEDWFQQTLIDNNALAAGGPVAAAIIITALIADILLPVPAAGVLAFSGATYGLTVSTLIGWFALNAGSALGRWLGIHFGLPLARRLCAEEELDTSRLWLDRFGPWMLACTRGLPVLAEASVLLAGVYRMSAKRFWPPVLFANLVVAAAYSALGHFASEHDRLGLALLISIVVPLLLLAIWLTFSRSTAVSR
ncbi:hypothetical protein AB833_25820 [Chromatiales bacterium (ex Bugula neritina AB1)]|nr:hypothetical protein AB833_25820 [Chromatiales bacterium (ex Bugula neritina AB1)]